MTFKRVVILVNYNLYESKRYFSKRLAEAFSRSGVESLILDATNIKNFSVLADTLRKFSPDFLCSFNRSPIDLEGRFWWDEFTFPFLSILVDPAYADLDIIKSPLSLISCVDQDDCELLRSHNFQNVFFLPHAVERELEGRPVEDKCYDVVLIGTCYDHESIKFLWKSIAPKPLIDILDDAADIVLSDNQTTFLQAIYQILADKGISPSEIDFKKTAYFVDCYIRGKDRFALVNAIKQAQVHIFGGVSWGPQKHSGGWISYFSSHPNVTVHPALPFAESMEIQKHSKICLNSMPFFKNGSHERIFTSLACGAVPITTSNRYVNKVFKDREDLCLYQPWKIEDVNDKVNALLSDEFTRYRIVEAGRNNVIKNHTWDNRVKELKIIFSELSLFSL